jgi:predicted Zn-dependent peptidase
MDHQTHILQNGIRIVHLPVSSNVAHLGVFINAGSRDEKPGESGMAHFIEHTIFKGTDKRKSYHILTRLESVGGELNAYTTKEETCVYASFLSQHFERALELISDIICHATFPAKELEKEKDVILDEINALKDSPSEEIFDLFEEYLFDGHPLAGNILGEKEKILSFKKEDVQAFIGREYSGEQIVICSAGGIDFNKLVRMAERYFLSIPSSGNDKNRVAPHATGTFNKALERPALQVHCMIGNTAYHRKDPRRVPLILLTNMLGGPALNSRLNLSIRERYGYAYNIDSSYQTYTDTGVFCIYVGTDNGFLDKCIRLIHKELDTLRKVKLGTLQLGQAKKQLMGQIALSWDSNLSRMLASGKNFMHDNRLDTLPEIAERIGSVTAEEIMDVSNQVFEKGKLSTLIFKNKI